MYMSKNTFLYEKTFLKVFFLGIILLAVVFLQGVIIPYNNFWIDFIDTLVVLAVAYFYINITQRNGLFVRKGAYWVENDTVFVETRNKTYSLNNVKALYGTTISLFGFQRAAMLKVDFGKKTLSLTCPSRESISSFSDSELYSMFETIVQHNSELKKDDELDFSYELKEL